MVCLRFACTSAGPRRRDDTFVVDATIVLRQPKAGSRARGAGDGPERWHWAGAPCGRGWTGRLTAGHLGDPDAVRPNPHCCPGAPMRPYDGNRVTAMETVRSLPAQQRGREGGRGQTRRAARPGFRSGRDGRSHAVRPSVGVGGHRLRDRALEDAAARPQRPSRSIGIVAPLGQHLGRCCFAGGEPGFQVAVAARRAARQSRGLGAASRIGRTSEESNMNSAKSEECRN